MPQSCPETPESGVLFYGSSTVRRVYDLTFSSTSSRSLQTPQSTSGVLDLSLQPSLAYAPVLGMSCSCFAKTQQICSLGQSSETR